MEVALWLLVPLLEPRRRWPAPKLEGEVASSNSVFATAVAMSVTEAGSCSGGECCHLSNGLSSSQGFSGADGISIAGVDGRRLGEAHAIGRELDLALCLRRAFASQLAIWLGFRSVCRSSSAFSSSLG